MKLFLILSFFFLATYSGFAQNPGQYFQTGMDYYKGQDYSKAIFYLSKSIEGDSEFFATFLYRGLAKNKMNDFGGAISDFNKAISLDESQAYMAYLNRGLAKDALEDFRGAVLDYDRASMKEPREIAPTYNRGLSRSKVGDCQGAIVDFNRVISSQPNFGEAYYTRGMCFLLLGEQNKGCSDLSKAGELGQVNAYDQIRKYCN